ncbi:MAG: type II toxin-antitoxin system Phd/YefM family antitoxin [Ignavibacteriales bacterium]|nr:type II toxin-antitoxin system Phd/YefM family antitoxin [Ignavibacteriales bacterium]MCF8435945.1 type II toxin-antitoxin system Phd/YefM family antitoxin [Ignavibacteriales bacterium]
MIEDANKNQKTFVITQNGEAKVIVQDLKAYEKTQETLALLKILSLSSKIFKAGRLKE